MTITGQLGIVRRPRPWSFGWVVSWVTRSPAYHVVVAISETECVSAEANGAVRRPVSWFPSAVWTKFDTTPDQAATVAAWANAHVGTPYDWLSDAVIGIHELTGAPIPQWLARWMSHTGTLMCSQLAVEALRHGGIDPCPGKESGEVSPADLDRYAETMGWTNDRV